MKVISKAVMIIPMTATNNSTPNRVTAIMIAVLTKLVATKPVPNMMGRTMAKMEDMILDTLFLDLSFFKVSHSSVEATSSSELHTSFLFFVFIMLFSFAVLVVIISSILVYVNTIY